MGKKLKLILFVLLPIICLVIAGIPFTLADYPETQIEQTMTGTSAEDTGASTADKSMKGGALYISGGASYTMTGGSITGKDNQYGGAVYVTNGSTFTMTGGTITGCTALYGGAIYVEAGGTCNITGGTITGNKAQFAPAIYVEDGGVLNVDQTAVIKDNEYERYGNALEIYVDGTLAKTMYLKADTYTINEADMPLQYENCCGYFLDEELNKCASDEVALTSEAIGFAPRTAEAEEYVAKLYTKTATVSADISYIYSSVGKNYSVKSLSTSLSGDIVLAAEVDNIKVYALPQNAFNNCKEITTMTLPAGLEVLGSSSMYGCSALTKINMPDSINEFVGSVFAYCSKLESITIPPLVTNFHRNNIHQCRSIKELYFHKNITEFGEKADLGLPALEKIVVEEGNPVYDSRDNCNALIKTATNTLLYGTINTVIPSSVTRIENYAFASNSIKSISIPETVTSIGNNVFYSCYSLESVSVPSHITTIPQYMFAHCSKLTTFNFSNNIKTIGPYAFYWAGLTSLSLPEGLETIGANAFYYNYAITGDLVIPNSVKTMGNGAFGSCFGFDGSLKLSNSLTEIPKQAFYRCEELTGTLEIPEGVTTIGDEAFSGCAFTGTIIIDDHIKSVGYKAFASLTKLEKVFVSKDIETISATGTNYGLFIQGSSNLVIYTDVANAESIPSGWGTYWNYYNSSNQLQVVYGCSLDGEGNIVTPTTINFYVDGVYHSSITKSETSYTVQESEMPLQYEDCCGYFLDSELRTTIKNDTIDLTNGDVNIYTRTADPSLFTFTTDGADGYILTKNSAVTYSGTEFNLVMPREYEDKTVTTIANSAFKGKFNSCGSVNITFSSEITEVPTSCFDADLGDYNCNIKSINIHNNITSIGNSAFFYCIGFTGSLIIGDCVTSIGDGAFSNCRGLTSVTIGDSVTSIGSYAFNSCSGLTGNLTIPDNVTSIGYGAFFYCSGLTSVYIPSTVTTISASSYSSSPFYGCSSNLVIYTDVANASSVPSGWGAYWNYYSSSGTLTVNYGYTLEQYKSAVGLTFAPNGEGISGVEVETIENVNDYQVDNSYLQDVILNKNEYVAILKENEKIA